MGYDENDAAEEAFYEHIYEEFHRDHADEIADEITTGEIISAVTTAHREWWPLTEKSIAKSLIRFQEAEYSEALFHVGRALDGYIKNVLVVPLTTALIERFGRFMPADFPIKQGDFFKNVTGLGSSSAMAEYSLSLVMTDAKGTIGELRALIRGGEDSPWRQRDRVFHAPIDADEVVARSLIEATEIILHAIVSDMERLIERERLERERIEFGPARMQMLRELVLVYDADPDTLLEEYKLPMRGIEHRSEVLGVFTANGFVERLEARNAWGRPEFLYRLTPEGRAYFEREIVPRLAAREEKAK